MKKSFTACILLIAIIMLSGCVPKSEENTLIYYNGKYFDSFISEDYTYNSFWTALSTADIEDKAYLCNYSEDTSKFGKKDETEIKRFSDKKLSMFILKADSFGEWLYLDTEYSLPSISSENIEEIIIKNNHEENLTDYYKSDSCVPIQDRGKITAIAEKLNEMEDLKGIKSYELKYIENPMEMYLKFKDINALYYVGMISKVNGNTVFYNAHKKQSAFYLMYEQNADNPF